MMLIVIWMTVFTVSMTLGESWLGALLSIVAVGIGVGIIAALRVLKKRMANVTR